MADEGFILLARRFFDHAYWSEPRRFSKAEAWIDLIALASFRGREVFVGSERVKLERGQVWASVRYLEKRWQWGVRQVHDYIHSAIDAGEVSVVKETAKGNIYAIVNYDTYQTSGNTRGKRKGNAGETNNKEGKEGNDSPNGESIREAIRIWVERFGGTAPGSRITKAFKPLLAKHPAIEVLDLWRKYLKQKDPQFVSAEDFAGKYSAWKEPVRLQKASGTTQQFDYSNATTEFKGFTK